MSSIIDEISDALATNDELMLKELERRDGIYSFIFHELEAANTQVTSTTHDDEDDLNNCASNCKFDENSTVILNTINDLDDEANDANDVDDEDEMRLVVDEMLEVDKEIEVETEEVVSTTTITEVNLNQEPHVEQITYIGQMEGAKPESEKPPATVIVPARLEPERVREAEREPEPNYEPLLSDGGCMFTSTMTTTMASTAGAHLGQGYMKAWIPPPMPPGYPLDVTNYSSSSSFMSRCNFRVRVPAPSFSQDSAPLVRNRHHALKETEDYRRCETCIYQTPDLRALFPLDPDVHAPFPNSKPLRVPYASCSTTSTASIATVRSPTAPLPALLRRRSTRLPPPYREPCKEPSSLASSVAWGRLSKLSALPPFRTVSRAPLLQ